MLKETLPHLVQYDSQGIEKSKTVDLLSVIIFKKAGLLEKNEYSYGSPLNGKIYSQDRTEYKTKFRIPEVNKIITQFKLLGFVIFNQIDPENDYWKNERQVYIAITDFGIDEYQKLYAYRK